MHQKLGDTYDGMMDIWAGCSDSQFDGKRRLSDTAAKREAGEFMYEVQEKMAGYGNTDDFSAADFDGLTELFYRAGQQLWDICLPPEWKP